MQQTTALRDDAAFRDYAATNDRRLEAELLDRYRGLALGLARRFVGRGEPLADLQQVAMLGLLRALRRYDPEMGVRFSTFATPTVLGELKRHLRDHGWALRMPRSLAESHLAIERVIEDLTQDLGHSPSIAEIADRSGLRGEDVLAAMEAGRSRTSMSMDAPDAIGDSLYGRLGADDAAFEVAEAKVSVEPAMQHLAPSERQLLRMRFIDGLTQTQIAKKLGTNQMNVSRRLNKTLARTRNLVGSDG